MTKQIVNIPNGVWPGLSEKLEDLGFGCLEFNGGKWYALMGAQTIIDSYTQADAKQSERDRLIPIIKDLAKTKILNFLPDWKQSNLNARMNELNKLRFDRPWTTDEQDEVSLYASLWARAEAIRAASDVHESTINSNTILSDLQHYDYNVNWPE